MKRRTFLQAMFGTSLLGLMPDAIARTANIPISETPAAGGDTVVFLSDLHVQPGGYMVKRLQKVVDTILHMNPRPKYVICLGDLVYLTGQVEEYQYLRPLMEPLWKAGIPVILAMGNHDRREEFAQVFPEFAAASLLKHRYVYKVELPQLDIIVLDSLQQGEDKTTWITPGALDDEQREWLQQQLNGRTKPVIVCSHHPIHELKIDSMLVTCPQCCGYIHGHDHRWKTDWSILNYSTPLVLRRLCLPSTGFWGDIGYSVMHLNDDKITVTLHQDDFYFPRELPEGEPKPAQWQMIVDDHQGQTCSFEVRK